MASEENGKKTVPENVEDQPASTVSEHTTNHQQTPKKGKRSPRRKAKSTFQPGRHGPLVQQVMFDREGKAIEGLENLFVSLANRFDYGDVVNALLIELTVTDYWRLSQVIQIEAACPNNIGAYPQLTRYLSASRRNLDKSLEMLRQLDKEAAEAKALAVEAEELEEEATTDPASMSQTTPTPETSEEPSTPAASMTSAHEDAAGEPQPTAAESTAAERAAETPAVEEAGESPATDLPAAA